MKVRFKPTSVIKARLGIQPNGPVQSFFTETCYKHMDKYVPYREGDLANNVIVSSNSITYKSPYAHYMYQGDVMGPNIPIKDESGNITGYFSPKDQPKRYTGKKIQYDTTHHEYAGPHWDERMWSAEKDDVVKEVQDYVNHGGRV